MKEQVIQRASNRGALASRGRSSGIVQRPARRERGATTGARAGALRKALAYAPLVGKVLLALIAGLIIFVGYRAASSASLFQARSIDVSGTSRVSADEIRAIVRQTLAPTGVWKADLPTISRTIVHRLPWVRSAVVSRVLPDGLRVRVTERVPLAVVRTSAGRFVWVDEDGVRLGAVSPADQMPPFFIRGWDEAENETAQAENRDRIEKYAEILREWNGAGLSQRISEVNLDDLRDVRAQLAGDDSQIEVRLGKENFGSRLKRALKVLDEKRDTPRGPFIIRLDVTQETRTIVGFSSGTPALSDSANSDSGDARTTKARGQSAKGESANRNSEVRDQAVRVEGEPQKKDKDQTAGPAETQSRPRRVR